MTGKVGQKRVKPNDESPRHVEYYQKRHPEWTLKECEDACTFFKHSQNYQCIEFYQTHYPGHTQEEYEKMLKDRVANKVSPQKIEYWKNKYPNESDEQIQARYSLWQRQHNYMCIEYYERKYPELTDKERQKMLEDKIKETVAKIDVSGEKNPMHRSRTTDLQRRQISPKCIEFYERKHPELSHEEHLKMLQKQVEKTNKTLTDPTRRTTNIEYYISRGLSEEDAKAALIERQRTFTLEKCIEKYGDVEGRKRFNERQDKWVNSLKKNFHNNGTTQIFQSSLGVEIFNELSKIIKGLEQEFHISEYFYDIRYKNKIVEINGDYWHANPNKYNADYFNITKQMYASEIWGRDNFKRICAEAAGYKVYYIWEYDYRKNPKETIQKCVEFLLND